MGVEERVYGTNTKAVSDSALRGFLGMLPETKQFDNLSDTGGIRVYFPSLAVFPFFSCQGSFIDRCGLNIKAEPVVISRSHFMWEEKKKKTWLGDMIKRTRLSLLK